LSFQVGNRCRLSLDGPALYGERIEHYVRGSTLSGTAAPHTHLTPSDARFMSSTQIERLFIVHVTRMRIGATRRVTSRCTYLNLTCVCHGARTACRLFLESPPHPQVSATAPRPAATTRNFHSRPLALLGGDRGHTVDAFLNRSRGCGSRHTQRIASVEALPKPIRAVLRLRLCYRGASAMH